MNILENSFLALFFIFLVILFCWIILCRWLLNFIVRFIAWYIYINILFSIIITVVWISSIPRVLEYIRSTEDFLGQHFALNPKKFSSVKFLLEGWGSLSSTFNDKMPTTNIIEPEPKKNSLDLLKNNILDIANDPNM